MKKKVHRSIMLAVVVSLMVFGTVAEYLGYLSYSDARKQELRSIANITIQHQDEPSNVSKELQSALDYDVEVTFIDFYGNVVYESLTDVSNLEDCSNMDEYTDAVAYGTGEAMRRSQSTGKRTYYYAIRQEGGVIRFSREVEGVLSVCAESFPMVLVAFVTVVIVASILSTILANRVVKPISTLTSQMDTSNGYDDTFPKEIVTEYSELEPIAETVQVLNDRVQKYIQGIREQKDRIRLITDNMVEGMIILDEKNDILSINKSAVKILNPDLSVEDDGRFSKPTQNKTLMDALEDIKEEKNIKEIITIGDNHYKAYINWAENINGTIILLVDVTETVKAEEVRRDFSANVSHELKTPLTTIKGFGELFENGMLTDIEDVKKYGAMIERESERLLFLINDIIRLSEIEEKSEKTLSPINLYDCCEYAINLLSQKATNKDISITLNSPKTVTINGHDGYMNELLINVIDNAIKYNKDGGSIVVTIKEDTTKVTISVADTGIGISQHDCERIFERFYRVDKSHSKKSGGTGLGLSIVKHIVNYHNGEIHIQSALDVGTTISIDIPKA